MTQYILSDDADRDLDGVRGVLASYSCGRSVPIPSVFGVLRTLKFATQEIYSHLLRKHLTPQFGEHRLCDISRVEIQHYLLEKLKQGFAWETTNHLRHLRSKVMGTAVSWVYVPNNPVRGVKMPERTLNSLLKNAVLLQL